ncbi:MAG: hypothetical protein KDD62_14800, partial [Bdellovibrionales bacterium]|nr:hypothetical protein [Bdellovibrionales bacterium]
MARDYQRINYAELRAFEKHKVLRNGMLALLASFVVAASPLCASWNPWLLFCLAFLPALVLASTTAFVGKDYWIEKEREEESQKRGGKQILGMPPERACFVEAIEAARKKGKKMIDKYLVGFNLETGEPIWIDEEDLCSHACVVAKTGVGKTLFLESLIFQQMLR